ncbi:MAG: sulfotransferase family 2 domain-containing protein [Natronohydrobacter sp.]|nr:sulfotransferase family 2 domain-containing protein [Natronohydrobacter sp.]
MIAAFDSYGVAFVGVPKCMSTSVLRSFYKLEHGTAFDRAAFGGNIHRFYRQRVADRIASIEPPDLAGLAGLWIFTIIRNPIRRLLSVYTNRVCDHRDIAKALEKAPDATLDPMPSADAFFRDLPRYRAQVPSIKHHTDNFAQFLGPDLARFDAVYRVEDADAIQDTLSERLGQPFVLENEQRSRVALGFDDLSPEAQAQIVTHTHPDFELLAPFYSLETSLRPRTRA